MTVCQRDRKEACAGRYAMVREGLCWYSWEMNGWLIIYEGVPTPHVRCPSCGGMLPTLVDSVLRMLSEREDDA